VPTKERYQERLYNGLCTHCGVTKSKKPRCPSCAELHRNHVRESRKRKRDLVYSHYGGYKCTCCGLTEVSCLCLDHINNDGNTHRKYLQRERPKASTYAVYDWAIRNNFPPILQVHCANCNASNASKARNNGICFHKSLGGNDSTIVYGRQSNLSDGADPLLRTDLVEVPVGNLESTA